jgi:hypothetical protein
VARLVPIAKPAIKLGGADGALAIPDDIDRLNPLIEEMFMPTGGRELKTKPRRRRGG